MPARPPGNGRVHGGQKGETPVTLDPEQSAALREKLLIELGTITSADLAAARARAALPAKNTLTATDAKLVEDAFEGRLSELASSDATAPSNADSSVPQIAAPQVVATSDTHAGEAKDIDKSILTVAAPRRYRNREHLRYVAQQACLVCGRKQSDPHHLRYLQPRALGRKASDEFAVPLCRSHHRAVHRAGDEQAWWKAASIDPVKVARTLWRQTRLDDPQEHHLADLGTPPKARDGTAESQSDQVIRGRADGDQTPRAARTSSSVSQLPPGSFMKATAPALPTSSPTVIGKPGRFAASAFRPGCAKTTYERTWDALSAAALNAALNAREAQAQFDGPQHKVSVRIAEHDGLIYLDLADEFWRCIEISADGWRIAEDPPVRFRRSAGMQAASAPAAGRITFLNLAGDNDFVLVVAWLFRGVARRAPTRL